MQACKISLAVQSQTLDTVGHIRNSIQQYHNTLNIIEAYLNLHYAEYEAGIIDEDDIFVGDIYLDGAFQLNKRLRSMMR